MHDNRMIIIIIEVITAKISVTGFILVRFLLRERRRNCLMFNHFQCGLIGDDLELLRRVWIAKEHGTNLGVLCKVCLQGLDQRSVGVFRLLLPSQPLPEQQRETTGSKSLRLEDCLHCRRYITMLYIITFVFAFSECVFRSKRAE